MDSRSLDMGGEGQSLGVGSCDLTWKLLKRTSKSFPTTQATNTYLLVAIQGQGSPLKATRYQSPSYCLPWAQGKTLPPGSMAEW